MAATALSRRLGCLALLFTLLLGAQQSKAIYHQLAGVGTALSARDASEAMLPFDQSFENYGRLRDDFIALTAAYSIVNDLEVTDQQIANHQAKLTVHWIMTLTDPQSGLSETREKDLTVKLAQKKTDWKITSIAPLEFFDPAMRTSK
jgi:hypothetical protein